MNRVRSGILFFFLLLSGMVYCQDLFYEQLVEHAIKLTKQEVVYDPQYYSIAYPNGDIPEGKGVCTDVIIRAYRQMDIDLQVEVHEDMLAHFDVYPQRWNLTRTDKNIDHRRVPNLMCFFERKGVTLDTSRNPVDYSPGDIVCWDLGGGITHIGIVIDKKSSDRERYMIVHNIGGGQVIEDMLFDYKIIGHYRFRGGH